MEIGKRFAQASAFTATIAMAMVVATASAAPLPPKTAQAAPTVESAAAAAPAPAVPTFVNGMAQPVFSASTAEWVNYELWVQSNFDSDRDGKMDRIHVDVSRPKETDTDGLKVPVIFEDSPYYAGGSDSPNFSVEHELGQPPAARIRAPSFFPSPTATSPRISAAYESYWVPRGYAVVHAESPGSGHSDGCTTSGGRNETLGAVAVIDWINGRAKGYTTRAGMEETTAAAWTNGKVGMMGTSYNGTIPIAAATTGVQGLDAIIPVEAISDWYDYYRANGLVRAPHSAQGGQNGNNGYLGEDLDVLAEYTYSRVTDTNPRSACWPIIDEITANEDRLSGNRSAFWDERNYMKDAGNIKAATLLVHGNSDYNVMSKNAAQLWAVLKANNVPRQFYFHQSGHTNPLPNEMANRWFTKYLWSQDNGVQNQPKSWVVRETDQCPSRQSTTVGEVANSTTLTVADASQFQVGNSLTIAQTNAAGTVTPTARTIGAIAGNTLTLATAVATAAGQRVLDGAAVSLGCSNANPTPYADWPDPATSDATLKLQAGGRDRGDLTFDQRSSAAKEKLTDDATINGSTLMNATTSPNRLIYQTNPLAQAVRISGSPKVSLNVAFSKPRANFSAALISFPAGSGNGTILTRGWMDPENRSSDYVSDPVVPGTFYRLNLTMQAKDTVVAAGRRLALMVFSSDREYTIHPAPGTEVTLDTADSTVTIPIVGGKQLLAPAIGEGIAEAPAPVGGSVPATLSLTLGAPASFGAFTPGAAKDYTATTAATVVSSAGDATLSVADPSTNHPGYLVNGAFALPQPLQGLGTVKTYAAPISNDVVPVTFKQSIGANDALRTGAYSKTLTFTLSTTTP